VQGQIRRFSGKAEIDKIVTLQELPDQKFWTDVFDELRSNYPADTIGGAKIEKWLKMPREPVKKGDFVFELDVGGMIISLRSEANGFVGPHLVEAGGMLEKGMVATSIFSAPDPLPSISEAEISRAMNESEGSISEFQVKLQDIEAQRNKALEDLVAAYHLATAQGLSESVDDMILARVPGQPNSVFVPPLDLYGPEVTKDQILEIEVESGTIKPAVAHRKGNVSNLTVDKNAVTLLWSVLRARPSSACVLHAASPHATALAAHAPVTGQLVRNAIRFPDTIAHDSGDPLADPEKEGQRVVQRLGDSNILMMSGGRGVIIVGDSLVFARCCAQRCTPLISWNSIPLCPTPMAIPESLTRDAGQAVAYDTLLRLERACRDAILAVQCKALFGAPASPAPVASSPPPSAGAAERFDRLKRLLRSELQPPRI
jgi:ribulose-5-phosphate 4-epimerase/fuculose-1-phosphate aldolase